MSDNIENIEEVSTEISTEENNFPVADKETIDNIALRDKDYIEAFEPYNLSNEDTMKLLKLITDYKRGDYFNLYSRLPIPMQDIVDGLRVNGTERMSKENATKVILDSFINDAKINNTIDEYTANLSSTINEINKEYDMILTSAIDDIFANIEQIRTEDPEKAKTLEAIKASFDAATSYEKISEFLDNGISPNKLKKFASRLDNWAFYFNKKVNVTDIAIPDINELVPIIKNHLPDYSEDTIKQFVVAIVRSDLNPNMDDISVLAYYYKLISNIYNYKFVSKVDGQSNAIFSNISKILDKINNLS